MTSRSVGRRLDDVEVAIDKVVQDRQQQQDQTLTEDEFVALVVDHIRDTGLDHDGLRWVARSGFYTEHDCAILASELNRWAEDQPGVVFLPLYQDEIDAALAAFDAGRFAFMRTDYLDYHWQVKDARTGSPILSWSRWDQDVDDLDSAVHRAAYCIHRQTGSSMPATLEDYRAWLVEVSPLGLAKP